MTEGYYFVHMTEGYYFVHKTEGYYFVHMTEGYYFVHMTEGYHFVHMTEGYSKWISACSHTRYKWVLVMWICCLLLKQMMLSVTLTQNL